MSFFFILDNSSQFYLRIIYICAFYQISIIQITFIIPNLQYDKNILTHYQIKKFIITMQPPQQTTLRSLSWRLWHSLNYLIGGYSYLIGSLLLFTFLTNPLTSQISGWIYTLGSLTFVLADLTQCIHYMERDCRFIQYVINFGINVIGSGLYLLGSICFIPEVNRMGQGLQLFIIASGFIIVAQIWKIARVVNGETKPITQIYLENKTGILVDFFAGIGALMYFIGSFLFQKANQYPYLINISAFIFTLGGLFFVISGCFIHQRYFWESKHQQKFVQQEDLMD